MALFLWMISVPKLGVGHLNIVQFAKPETMRLLIKVILVAMGSFLRAQNEFKCLFGVNM